VAADRPPALLADYPFTSSGVTALQAQDGNVLLLGALELDAQLKAVLNISPASTPPQPPLIRIGSWLTALKKLYSPAMPVC